ncbi:MAG: GDP-L-fucose synthase [Nitrospirae bacterium]|nr:GDP-L-fucose synthase [Nitrospirota bacterium]MBF0535522.1 GDP-L-fucose synthase [Nitrospirota bacterium]MBF0617451.1 GDP-L-fucose synthase [Nitrospirota bacterium]
MNKGSKIYVSGHRGLVGRAVMRRLEVGGYSNIVVRGREELDLKSQEAVKEFFMAERPEYVFLAAAKVGGIMANNTYPAEFIYDNLVIETNVVHNSYLSGVKKLLFLGSSCIYPKFAPQPMKEEYLLAGILEPTNEPYAIAKIAGIILCQSYNRQYGTGYISAMPTNLYGPYDNFDLNNSHVLPAMIKKFHDSKAAMERGVESPVVLWGTGSPCREFLHVDDLADALIFLMDNYNDNVTINVGTGTDQTIAELAEIVKDVVGFKGEVIWDSTKPDGTPRKLLDTYRLTKLGWSPKITLRDGIRSTYDWFCKNYENIK